MKAMVFIDGGWMVGARKEIFSACNGGETFDIDYVKMPKTIVRRLEDYLNYDIEVNRTHYFAVSHSDDGGYKADKFLSFLKEKVGYGVINVPKCVAGIDVAIAANVMLYGHLDAFDVAVICSDRDSLIPLVTAIRQMGKQVQFVTTKSICDTIMQSGHGHTNISDFPIISVDEFGEEFRLMREKRVRKCRKCGKEEETEWDGPSFFCSKCKAENRRNRTDEPRY